MENEATSKNFIEQAIEKDLAEGVYLSLIHISGSGRKLIFVPVSRVRRSFGSRPSSSSMVGIPRS